MNPSLPPQASSMRRQNYVRAAYERDLLQDLRAVATQIVDITLSKDCKHEPEVIPARITSLPRSKSQIAYAPLEDFADGAFSAFKNLIPLDIHVPFQGSELLLWRRRIAPKTAASRRNRFRFLKCKDGVIAANLLRKSDWELVNAWLMQETPPHWAAIQSRIKAIPKSQLLHQARELGLAIADAQPADEPSNSWFQINALGAKNFSPKSAPLVVDLSSLWAGPLCGQLLRWAGARVIKVESSQRPDGTRMGSPRFYRALNEGKQELTLDLHRIAGRDRLRALIASADIVIEASRPRALRQLGIVAEEYIAENRGMTWISITGYGRQEPEANWVAFGDDAGVAGGLSAEIYRQTGMWTLCGDAIADPLTGIHAALAATASWRSGGGHLLSLPMVQIVKACLSFYRPSLPPCPTL